MSKTQVCLGEPESKSKSMEWKQTDSPVKKKIRVQQSVIKVILIVLWDIKDPSLWFSWKSATVKFTPIIEWQISPGGNTQQGTNYTATCLPSRKLSKLDEPDMQDAAGEARTSL